MFFSSTYILQKLTGLLYRDLFGISTSKMAAMCSIWHTALFSRTNKFLFTWLEEAADGQRLCGHQIVKETTSVRPFSVLTRWPSLIVVCVLTCGECWFCFGSQCVFIL